MKAWEDRGRLTHFYSWAVPNSKALEAIAEYSPIVEIGAGTGYWAKLLQDQGCDVLAFDKAPPHKKSNPYHDCGVITNVWTEIRQGSASVLKRPECKGRALFLCWPPYNTSMASDCLRYFKGDIVIYVGEGGYGCTGDEAFHNKLNKDFEHVKTVGIPQWHGIHDCLTVWKRK